jgi:hypothetical protein
MVIRQTGPVPGAEVADGIGEFIGARRVPSQKLLHHL